jgi:CBS domain-containing protein
MKVRDVMTPTPACCLATDTAQRVAEILRDQNVGSVPVVQDQESRRLTGIITDRDLCCSVIAQGLDPKNTPIERFITRSPVTCREDENLEECERAMQEHRIRRIPIVDAEGLCIGIISQADLALNEQPERFAKTVAEISKPEAATPSIAA